MNENKPFLVLLDLGAQKKWHVAWQQEKQFVCKWSANTKRVAEKRAQRRCAKRRTQIGGNKRTQLISAHWRGVLFELLVHAEGGKSAKKRDFTAAWPSECWFRLRARTNLTNKRALARTGRFRTQNPSTEGRPTVLLCRGIIEATHVQFTLGKLHLEFCIQKYIYFAHRRRDDDVDTALISIECELIGGASAHNLFLLAPFRARDSLFATFESFICRCTGCNYSPPPPAA